MQLQFPITLAKQHIGFFSGIFSMCMNKAGLAIGTSSKKAVKIANTVEFSVNGSALKKTTAEVAFTATTMDIAASTSVAREACYLLSLDASGNATITMGDIASGAGNGVVPATPADQCPIGYVRIRVAAGSTPFDATTDDLDAAHLTCTYVDLRLNPIDFSSTVPTA